MSSPRMSWAAEKMVSRVGTRARMIAWKRAGTNAVVTEDHIIEAMASIAQEHKEHKEHKVRQKAMRVEPQ